MKKTNKIISLLSAMGIVASMFSAFAISANAASIPTVTLEGVATGKTSGSELTITVKYTNETDENPLVMAQGIIDYDDTYLEFKDSTKKLTKASKSPSGATVKYSFVAMDEDSYVTTKDVAITEIKFNIIKDVDKPIQLATSGMKVAFDVSGQSVEYTVGGDNALTVNTYTLAPDPTIKVEAASATVTKGGTTTLTATPANFAETPDITWSVEGAASANTKVETAEGVTTLTVGEDETATSLTVKATAGDVVGSATIAVVDKVYPVAVTASDFADNKTTITIAPGADYIADTEYTVTAQFYTADGTASGYVEIAGLKNAQTLKVGSQLAAKVNVKITDADGNIIGVLAQK